MHVETDSDPTLFLAAAEPLLLADEARHNLAFGILATLIFQPGVYDEFRLWRVDDEGRTVGAALQTPPFPIVLARPARDCALKELAVHLAASGEGVPGVVGATQESEEFAAEYTSAAGVGVLSREEQGIYALTEVEAVPVASGAPRPARPADRNLILEWYSEFHAEVESRMPWNGARVLEQVDARIAEGNRLGLWLWEDGGKAVSLSGAGGPTPTGIRVGPVYTPPELRGRGYATSLVAAMSAALLAGGRQLCFLYTDMTNPISNAIYRRIGYRWVCGSLRLMFG